MTLFKQLKNNRSCLMCNGKTLVFGIGGACEIEDAGLLPEYTTSAIRVNVISVLQSNDYLEIALDYSNGDFKKYRVSESVVEVFNVLKETKGFSHILTRKGMASGIRFTQAFFVYPCDTMINEKIKRLSLEEVK